MPSTLNLLNIALIAVLLVAALSVHAGGVDVDAAAVATVIETP